MTYRLLKTALAAALIGLPVSAGASILNIDGGSSGSIPDTSPGSTESNDALGPLGLTAPLSGYFGAQISTSKTTQLRFEFIGFEAGYENTFSFGGNTFDTENESGNTNFDANGLDAFTAVVGAGQFPFTFSSVEADGTTPVGSTTNGSNPNNSGSASVNFFASIEGDPTGKTGDSVLLFLDDTGAGDDDNHDDMVVRVSAVPVPAGGVLLLTALGGLGLARRRRRAA